jgi:DNA-binding NtrC family response regulator
VPPLRERRQDIVHLANIFLQQFAALYRRPAQRFSASAEQTLLAYPWPGNVRELQNMILTTVLFHDSPEVDGEDLHGFYRGKSSGSVATAAPPQPPLPPAIPAELRLPSAPGGTEPAMRLRQALAREIATALEPGRAPVPLGKWLTEDLVLTADRLAGGKSRQASQLLGIADTTYRRQLQAAQSRHGAGLDVRSASWSAVSDVLEDFIKSRSEGADVVQWAEDCLLTEAEFAAPGDTRKAAALLGVTQPTLLRRKAQLVRQS